MRYTVSSVVFASTKLVGRRAPLAEVHADQGADDRELRGDAGRSAGVAQHRRQPCGAPARARRRGRRSVRCSAARPAAVASGLPASVPAWNTGPSGDSVSMISRRPPTEPMGRPPPMTLPNVVRSGRTSYIDLGAAVAETEPGDDLVEHQQRTDAVAAAGMNAPRSPDGNPARVPRVGRVWCPICRPARTSRCRTRPSGSRSTARSTCPRWCSAPAGRLRATPTWCSSTSPTPRGPLRGPRLTVSPGRLRRGAARVVVVATPENRNTAVRTLPPPRAPMDGYGRSPSSGRRGCPPRRRCCSSRSTGARAVAGARDGQGYADGLAGLARDFGVDVADDGPPAPTGTGPDRRDGNGGPAPTGTGRGRGGGPGRGEGRRNPGRSWDDDGLRSGGGSADAVLGEVVNLTNAERASTGSGARPSTPRLAAAAQPHSADMLRRGFFAHESPDGGRSGTGPARSGTPTARSPRTSPPVNAPRTRW